MKRIAVLIIIFLGTATMAIGQLKYYVPSHYFGIYYAQSTSAKARGMGLTTITHNGIETSFYNPATIGPGKEKLNVHINYASGDPVRPKSKYPFIGISYKLTDKLSLGASTFRWVDNDPVWTTIIGTYNESVDKRVQTMYGVNVAYEVIPGLHAGIAANSINDIAVPGAKTSSSFIMSLGGTYDREVNFIGNPKFTNQKIRVAASFINLLMNNKVTQKYENFYHYRDVPIHVYLGGAYNFSLPFHAPYLKGKRYFESTLPLVDLGLHFQLREVLPGSDPNDSNHENGSHIAIGAEAWFLNRVALRMGYYYEKRPTGMDPSGGVWVTTHKKGFTWGYGTLVPLSKLSKGKVPFDAEVNFVTSKLLGELGKNTTHPKPFTESNFSFNVGVNLKWVR